MSPEEHPEPRQDPLGRQEAVLAALDKLIEFERFVQTHKPGAGTRHGYSKGLRDAAARSLAGLEGRRRIIQRHAPAGPADCEQCGRDSWNAPVWPCPDWLDATAGLEEGRTDG